MDGRTGGRISRMTSLPLGEDDGDGSAPGVGVGEVGGEEVGVQKGETQGKGVIVTKNPRSFALHAP